MDPGAPVVDAGPSALITADATGADGIDGARVAKGVEISGSTSFGIVVGVLIVSAAGAASDVGSGAFAV